MLTLALSTADGPASFALEADGVVLTTWSAEEARGSGEALVLALHQTAQDHGIRLGDLERIVVTVGPGNFTGVRAGVSLAQGVALGSGAEAFAVTTFEAIAAQVASTTGPLLVALDGRVGKLMVQPFGPSRNPIADARLVERDQVPEVISAWRGGVVGPGLDVDEGCVRALLRDHPHSVALDSRPITAEALLRLPDRLKLAPVTKIRPMYLRAADAAPAQPFATLAK